MGKSKKNRKEVEIAVEVESEPESVKSEEEEVQVKKPPKAKKGKDNKKADTEVVKQVKALKIEDDSDEDEKPAVKQSAFALLDIESGGDDPPSEEEIIEVKKKQPAKKQVKKQPSKEEVEEPAPQKASKKSKKKKKAESDDDDLDRMIAQLKAEFNEPDKKPVVEKKTEEVEEPKSKNKKKKKKEEKLEEPVVVLAPEPPQEEETKDEKKKKKGAKKDEEKVEEKAVDAEKAKKKPNKALVARMQEQLRLKREEEERLQKEEEEKERILEEADRQREEERRLKEEQKERKKQKEKERRERLKAEGKLLTKKQKEDQARAQAMLEALKAQGAELPQKTEKPRPRPGTRIRPKNKAQQQQQQQEEEKTPEPVVEEVTPPPEEVKNPEDDVKDSWDADSDSDDDFVKVDATELKAEEEESEDSDEESDDDDDDEDDESDETESEEEDDRPTAEKLRERAEMRIRKRAEDAEKARSIDNLRAAVVCVLGHVDTGKTKILDKLRRTNVQDGEAGGITQQIGATNVPIENIKEQTKFIKGFSELEFKLPGLLIIDTPGHESFSNLRSRGSSLCDIAILVVDIMHGLEPQTIESINLLKQRKTPFIVALNKIDRLYDWNTFNRKDIRDIIKSQPTNVQNEFKERLTKVIGEFSEQGLNAALFYENPDPRSYISLVPTSAVTGEGMGNLLFLIVQFCQNQLARRLTFTEELQATVLEVKAISGLGITIDCILVNGRLREGQTMILAGTDGPIQTQVKALLMPQPMKELRVKNQYIEHKEVVAAQGVKIAAKELEKVIAGLNLYIAHKNDEIEIFKERAAKDLRSVLSSIKLSERGVFVQASTLGSLEALLQFLKDSKIPYAGIRIGPVVKKDVMKASIMLEHDSQYATILAFDVKIERDAQELADHLTVKIFQADIIYHLFDQFTAYRDELKQRKREEFKSVAVFPCKLKVLPQFVFNSRDPIVAGVIVEAGIVKEGTPICVPSKDFIDVGIVTSIEINKKAVETARKGQEVCIKIEPIPGEAPKMFGRHFDETDFLVSKISRPSINACKDHFRDDLLKSDWSLMKELKTIFQIL